MNEQQMSVIVGLISGMQGAIVTLCNALHDKGVLHKQDAARYFSPEMLPPDMRDSLVAMVYRQIAAGILSSGNSNEHADQRRQLFRVIDGGQPNSGDTTQQKAPTDGE